MSYNIYVANAYRDQLVSIALTRGKVCYGISQKGDGPTTDF